MKINWKIIGGYCLGVAAANLYHKGYDLVCADAPTGWLLLYLFLLTCCITVCLATEKP